MFLDRDGTLNRKAPEGSYVARPAELELLPGVPAALARLNAAGVATVLVTNQRWMSRPGADHEDYRRTHARLVELLAAGGARLDAAYVCPHERGACRCRKPAPGMLERAAAELGLDPAAAVIVGDADSDLLAGRAAGVGTILLRAGVDRHPDADAVVPDLEHAVGLLLGDAVAVPRPRRKDDGALSVGDQGLSLPGQRR